MNTGPLFIQSSWAPARRSFRALDNAISLRLVETRTFGSGVVYLRYQGGPGNGGDFRVMLDVPAHLSFDIAPGQVILRRLTATRVVSANEREGTMPLYLSRFSYTPETWARLIGNPEDRRKAAQSYIESVGGKLHGFWYAFGTHDGYNLWEAPDNVSMAAVALAISGGGALSSLETTVLLTVEETMDALRKAKQVQYRAPGA